MSNPFRHTIKLLPALAATAAVAAVAAPAASASATTYCVNDPSCVGTVEPGVQEALDAASGNPGDDTVRIGPGSYSNDGGFLYDSLAFDNGVAIVGAGKGSTTLRMPGDPKAFETVLSLNDGSSVRALSIKIPGTPGVNTHPDVGLNLEGSSATQVTVGAASTVNDDTGLFLDSDASFVRGTISLPSAAGAATTGVSSRGATALSSTTVTASTAFSSSTNGELAKLNRVTLRPGGDYGYGVWTDAGPISIKDSLIDLGSGLHAVGLLVANSNGSVSPKSIGADHVTIVGGGASSTGLRVLATSAVNNGRQLASATLTNSAISGPAVSIDREAQNTATTNPGTSKAIVKTRYSNYKRVTAIDTNGQNGVGSLTDTNFVPGSPTFVGGGDYTPAPGSILVDSGDPAFSGGVDLAGSARVADGDGDATAVTDLGAYERQP
jgi:hypothetical protein